MDATNLSNASYSWKSIIKGREVIKRGALWRIGIGTLIDIWGDNWLPTRNNPRIISPLMLGLPSHNVSNLIVRTYVSHLLGTYVTILCN